MMEPHPPGRFEFAFPHTKGEPWWLTDGYGYSREVSPPVWLFYRAGRRWRTARFNRRIQGGAP
jgi:hypothetical protein